MTAVMDVLLEDGLDNLSIAKVAALAGVHETSIYRRWGTRERLLYEALFAGAETPQPVPDTGSIKGDFAVLASDILARLRDPKGKLLFQAVIIAENQPELDDERRRVWQTRLDVLSTVIRRGIERGELNEDIDPALAFEMLAAPIAIRVMVTREPVEEDLPERLATILLNGLGVKVRPKQRKRTRQKIKTPIRS